MTAPLDVLASFSRDTGGFRCTNKQAKELAEACAAVAQLVEAGRKLRMHRAGVATADAMFVAPVIAKADAEAFVAALARVQGK